MRLFFEYTRLVFGKWDKLHGALAFYLTVIALISGMGTQLPLPDWFWLSSLAITLYVRTFLVYRDVVKGRPTGAALQLQLQDAQFLSTDWRSVLPRSPKLRLAVDVRNRGQEKARMQILEFSLSELNTSMFKPTNDVKIYISSTPMQPITMPLDVPARDELNLVMERGIEIVESNPEAFVRGVKDLTCVRFEIKYRYVDMDENMKEGTIGETVSYEDFRNSVLRNLVNRKNYELAYILKGNEPQ